ncbi:hypothetical protein D9M72_450070 [compost metagenome]
MIDHSFYPQRVLAIHGAEAALHHGHAVHLAEDLLRQLDRQHVAGAQRQHFGHRALQVRELGDQFHFGRAQLL